MSNKESTTKSTNTMMGTAPSRCNKHDFETTSIDEWNAHQAEEGHTDSGVVCCTKCGAEIIFERIPYQHQGVRGKDIQLRCEKCITENDDLNRQILSQAKNKEKPNTDDNNQVETLLK